MGASFFFYDVETSGISPREARVMQFAGQRTDLKLRPIGEPVNVLIKLAEDVLPDPDAVLITGITPQVTQSDGISEAAFLNLFHEKVAIPETIFVGFNSVRFDDEFIRYLHYRNFYDPYEWQWQDGRSRWDLLDVVRMMRALRPDEIEWPVDAKGQPTNRLELIASLNKLDHANAHDALSDVQATIALARLIRSKQPKLFDFLLKLRDKHQMATFTSGDEPFVYTSGQYPAEFEKTTVVAKIADRPSRQGILVYDLRFDPSPFAKLRPERLAEIWATNGNRIKTADSAMRLPVKTLQFNRCPAVAPMSVLDEASLARLKLSLSTIETNFKKLQALKTFPKRVLAAQAILDAQLEAKYAKLETLVDAALYDGFFANEDRPAMQQVRSADEEGLQGLQPKFSDRRLRQLLPLYKARNFPAAMSEEENNAWEEYRLKKLLDGEDNSRFARYMVRLTDIAAAGSLTAHQEYLLEELRLWGESVVPDTGSE